VGKELEKVGEWEGELPTHGEQVVMNPKGSEALLYNGKDDVLMLLNFGG
jgi:hypothetical protein